jgi:hypothetical protein
MELWETVLINLLTLENEENCNDHWMDYRKEEKL